ncbi:Asp-tRNA(Asn)/Glu-tRNA(Gln) amidotransferase subunit GatA [Acidilobus sp.]|jgi:aspartyl-tRNA(Asn)/glutamyl-tRNA(Gln) amidotransferase subunit A|uniref:Asp-tRNA(Asn)/Glu-tRNA(Gln) amidotransferase subunit GatA n=1 Tax=Acidilobus sp. TaxID=1872109 RepID=UPI003D0760DE
MRTRTAASVLSEMLSGSKTPEEHVMEVYEAIERWEPKVKGFITLLDRDLVIKRAKDVERELREGRKLPLAGLVVAVKDNISTSFAPTTAGSRILSGYVPPFNATVIERLLEAGAIIIGKTNMDEFAMGSTTELSGFWPTRNPWDLDRVPGGSSGGSAAVLAYGGADLALGSDTGGSVRLPAAYTGTVGLKPTYGLVSRYGLIPYANSLEQISPMARSVRDVALLLEVIAGHDPRDATSLAIDRISLSSTPSPDPRDFRICVPHEMIDGSDAPVRGTITKLLDKLQSEGVEVNYDVSLPSAADALPIYYTIALAEAASNLARYDGKLYPFAELRPNYTETVTATRARGFGREVKRRIVLGVMALSEGYRDEFYVAAAKGRRLLRDEVLRLTRGCVVAGSVSPTLPPRIGERITDPLKLYALDVYTVIANLAGVPSLAMPAGFYNDLPVGVQFMAGPLEEAKLVALGELAESVTGLGGAMA